MTGWVGGAIGTVFILALVTWVGCRIVSIAGNGRIRTEERACVAGVRRIVVSGPWQVDVFAGAETDRCVIRTDENLFDYFKVAYKDGTVTADVRRNLAPTDRLHLEVYSRSGIEFFSRRGSGAAHIRQAETDRMTVDLTGSGDFEMSGPVLRQLEWTQTGSGRGQVVCARIAEVKADVTGSGDLQLSGELGQVTLEATGSGDVEINKARGIELDQTGSGDARLTATETISGSSTGSGDITCSGGARVAVEKIGSGELRVE